VVPELIDMNPIVKIAKKMNFFIEIIISFSTKEKPPP